MGGHVERDRAVAGVGELLSEGCHIHRASAPSADQENRGSLSPAVSGDRNAVMEDNDVSRSLPCRTLFPGGGSWSEKQVRCRSFGGMRSDPAQNCESQAHQAEGCAVGPSHGCIIARPVGFCKASIL